MNFAANANVFPARSSLYPCSQEYVCDQERNTKAIPFITFVIFLIKTFGTDFVLHLGPLLHLAPISCHN